MKWTKIAKRIAYLLAGFLTLALATGVFVAEGTLHPGRRPLSKSGQALGFKMAELNDADLAEVSISANDGAALQAWNLHPRKDAENAVILFHGLSDNRLGMLAYAQIFLKHGYDVLMPDARAHGTSGGGMATYGLLEADDIRLWIDWLNSHVHPACIYGFAESMGAAGLLQSLQFESRFCAVAAESPFSSFREVAYDRVGQFFRAGPWLGRTILRPIVEFAFAYAKFKYHLDFESVSPQQAVATTKTPVLLIHGQIDRNIPVRHSMRIAARNHSVVLWQVPGADHCGAIGAAPDELERRVVDWFEQHRHMPNMKGFASRDSGQFVGST
jgi:dipeptidyl aminopeptidase/acylaminoacyl peptidase